MSESKSQPRLPVKQVIPLGRVQKVMARAMLASVQRAALSQVTRDMDLSVTQAGRRAAGENRLSLNIYIMAAVAQALRRHPMLNAELVDDQVLVHDVVNLGLAVSVPNGLIVAVIHGADQKTLPELATAVGDLTSRARTNQLGYADIDGGTFTVSNLGTLGIDGGFSLPRPPEGAILLVGRVRPRPEIVAGAVVVRDMALFSLTFDHRFIDGAAAAGFLQELQDIFLSPASPTV